MNPMGGAVMTTTNSKQVYASGNGDATPPAKTPSQGQPGPGPDPGTKGGTDQQLPDALPGQKGAWDPSQDAPNKNQPPPNKV
ncbi:MAG: hypothetical protein JWM10_1958 [Myxococcaceae bacterium]|nr:hypothetical protein [Myxococcaceae bacterium]